MRQAILVISLLILLLLISSCSVVQESKLPSDVSAEFDVSYGPDSRYHTYDVFYKEDVSNAAAVILVHGGSVPPANKKSMHSRVPMYSEIDVVSVAVGFGPTSQPYDFEESTQSQVHDVACALVHFRENANKYGVDPEKIVIHGYSAGGNVASDLAYTSELDWLEDCTISSGDITLKGFIGESTKTGVYIPKEFENTVETDQTKRRIIGPSELIDILEAEYSWDFQYLENGFHKGARNYVDPTDPPAFWVHGTADQNSPYNRSHHFVNILEESGVKNYLHTVQDGSHTLKIENRPNVKKNIQTFVLAVTNDNPWPFSERTNYEI